VHSAVHTARTALSIHVMYINCPNYSYDNDTRVVQSDDDELNTVEGLLQTIREHLAAAVPDAEAAEAIMKLVDRLVEEVASCS
jgi:hypothetical protein